ncbi:UNVERIFIED_CONTAM: Frmpd4 [Trichonephila clavipes]
MPPYTFITSCKHSVKLKVCQPITNNTTRKSALLTAAKKAKLKSNPSRVRFAEGVVINGSPLYCPSPFDSHVPFMPNVLKVFLENGQTKSFKYDSTTTVQINILIDNIELPTKKKFHESCFQFYRFSLYFLKRFSRHFCAIKIRFSILSFFQIAARPGAHHLRCLFRLTFVPKDIYDLMQRDPVAFDYLFLQSCNDVVKERFAPELKYDVALRLAALHLQQHAVSSGMQGKLVVKAIEREYGLEKFVPMSLLETMKRKELLKLLSQLMKQNQALSGPGQKQLTATQAKFHYLKIVSDLPTYGAKSFATCTKDPISLYLVRIYKES